MTIGFHKNADARPTEDHSWMARGVCSFQGIPRDCVDDPRLAEKWSVLCDHCPVRKQCLDYGIRNKLYGLWGGLYLNYGRSPATMKALRDAQAKKPGEIRIHGGSRKRQTPRFYAKAPD